MGSPAHFSSLFKFLVKFSSLKLKAEPHLFFIFSVIKIASKLFPPEKKNSLFDAKSYHISRSPITVLHMAHGAAVRPTIARTSFADDRSIEQPVLNPDEGGGAHPYV